VDLTGNLALVANLTGNLAQMDNLTDSLANLEMHQLTVAHEDFSLMHLRNPVLVDLTGNLVDQMGNLDLVDLMANLDLVDLMANLDNLKVLYLLQQQMVNLLVDCSHCSLLHHLMESLALVDNLDQMDNLDNLDNLVDQMDNLDKDLMQKNSSLVEVKTLKPVNLTVNLHRILTMKVNLM
jgi:hypothetical protein